MLILTLLVSGCGGDDSSRHITDAPKLACDPAPAVTCARLGPDFVTTSTGMNPVGPWSYGSSPTLGGAFSIYTLHFDGNNTSLEGLEMWASDVVDGGGAHLPTLGINATATTIDPIGTYTVAAGQILGHPGQSGQYSIARWTAPAAGTYRVQATFGGLSGENGNPPTSTDVHVRHNADELLTSSVTLYGAAAATCNATAITAAVADTIDFAVGIGGNDYFHDSTSIDAAVCPM